LAMWASRAAVDGSKYTSSPMDDCIAYIYISFVGATWKMRLVAISVYDEPRQPVNVSASAKSV
jgi:hypothetical protein